MPNKTAISAQPQNAGTDTVPDISQACVSIYERLATLNAKVIQDAMLDSAMFTKTLTNAKYSPEVLSICLTQTQNGFSKLMSYATSVLEISSQNHLGLEGLKLGESLSHLFTPPSAKVVEKASPLIGEATPNWTPGEMDISEMLAPEIHLVTKHNHGESPHAAK
jgi:hypothetical protein